MENIKAKIISGQYKVSFHAKERASEQKINLQKAIAVLSKNEPVRTWNQKGEAFIFTQKFTSGRELRMVVGHDKVNTNQAYIVTMYITDEDDNSIGKRYNKFNTGEVSYDFG